MLLLKRVFPELPNFLLDSSIGGNETGMKNGGSESKLREWRIVMRWSHHDKMQVYRSYNSQESVEAISFYRSSLVTVSSYISL